MWFTDGRSYFEQYTTFAEDVLMFGFDTVSAEVPVDSRVRDTIVTLLAQYFTAHENSVLLFVCDSSDNRQMNRRRKFNAWHKSANELPVAKVDVSIFGEDSKPVYLSVLYHSENKHTNEILAAVNELQKNIEDK